ncbi:unnamed protein product [Brachionus calyciflorus]|uniref:Meckelin n=1 Tax=Brachionus calyciflorus TaxID=104777 RepID=A0A813MH09_9BILA|nr:unnamed protein product [Brachionus calyciflorus]
MRFDPFIKYFLYVLVLIEYSSQQITSISLNTTELNSLNCSSNEIFDFTKLECKKCPNNSFPLDKFNCKCNETFYFTINNGGNSIRCTPCKTGQIQTLDGFSCIEPPTSSCSSNIGIITDTDQYGSKLSKRQCIVCDDKFSKPLNGACKSCKPFVISENDNQTIETSTCNLNPSGGFLFFDNSVTIPFNNINSYFENSGASWLFNEFSLSAFRTCRIPNRRNMTSCQFLANLNVLKLYTRQPLMEQYDSLFNPEEPNSLPWLKYQEDLSSYYNLYSQNGIDSEFLKIKFKNKCQNTDLELISAEYDLWGTFKNFESFDIQKLNLCYLNSNSFDQDIISSPFTTSKILSKCSVDVQRLFELSDSKNTIFYDLYLKFGNGTKLLPIPVKIYETGKNKDDNLFRRFFLLETTSSKNSADTKSTHIRFAKSVKITIELIPGKSNGEIYPPLIEIEYDTARREDKKIVYLNFEIEYKINVSNFRKVFFILFGTLSGLAFLYSCLSIWNWNRRSGRFMIDIITIFKFLMFLISSVGNSIMIALACISIYWFIVYRNQMNVILFLPDKLQEKIYGTFLIIAFCLKLVDVIYLILVQTSFDIFFIDWEKPKNDEKSLELKKRLPPIDKNNQTSLIMEQIKEQNKISCWRTLFVANEWNELQTFRKINTTIHLILVLFLLKVINLEAYTRQECQPDRNDITSDTPYSFILRLGISFLVFTGVEFFQLFVYTVMYSRCIEDKIGQFVDFCSISNISMLIMTHTQYGYYIHGRSPHGQSDTSMYQMTQSLIREEIDMSAKRGLESNSNHQTFSIKVPNKFIKEYSKKRSVNRAVRRDHITSSNEFEKRMLAYTKLNNFLISFLNNSIRGINYSVHERNICENLFNIEFKQPIKNGYFYKDEIDCFTDVIYFGKEKTLFLFDLVIFLFVDYLSESYILAALIVYITSKILKIFRSDLGRRNLSKKTLVDKRFLI